MKEKYTHVSINYCVQALSAFRKVMLFTSLLTMATVMAFAQSVRVTGTVKGLDGETLPGVSVRIKGTQTGTTTDVNGAFSLNVPNANSEVQFSFIGFVSQEIKVGSRTAINVTLQESSNDLNEVVVTGYGGTVKKRDLTSASSTVTAKMIEDRQPLSIFDALQGQATGVLVVNDNGEPGAEGSITIRGPSTFSSEGQSTNPLYVVDGVITENFSAINPSDIQSFEILKDAASAAIYGSRAANGVILITTKRGVEGKPRLDAQYVYTMGRIAHEIQQSSPKDIRYYRGLQSRVNSDLTDSLNPGLNSANDLQKLLLGNLAQKHDVRLSLSGGQKGLTYAASLNYLDDKGIALNTYIKRIQSRINVDYQAAPKLKYSTNISVYRQAGNFANIGNSIRPVFDRPSSFLIYYPDGTLTSYINNKRNPIANAMYEKNTREEYKIQFVNSLNYDFTKDLKLTLALNTQLDDGERFFFAPRYVFTQGGDRNSATNQFNRRFYYEAQAYLNYNKTIKNHSLGFTVGATRDRGKYSNVFLSGENFVLENVITITGANIVNLPAQRVTQNAFSTGSYFARANYSFKGKYLLSGVFRNDASSRFGKDNRSGNFGSGSIAWRFTDENFLNFTKSFLDDGKLRLSYGTLGNDAIGDYESIPRVELGGNSYNGIGGISTTANFNNNALKWETTTVQNIGLDLNFLKGRVTATIDAYIRNTGDLLYDRQMPKETGYNTIKVNVGDIQNKGFEFSLIGSPISNKNFNWTVNANFSLQRGTIKSLFNNEEFIAFGTGGVSGGNATYLIREGGRIGDFYGWKNLGVYQYDASNAYTPDGQRLTPVDVVVSGTGRGGVGTGITDKYVLNGQEYTGEIVKKRNSDGTVLLGGDTEWLDVNNDGIINDDDRHIIGNAQADFYLGLVNSFTYKQFSLSFIINSTVGGSVYNQFKQNLTNWANNGNPSLPEAIYGAWAKQGDIATYPYYPDKNVRNSQRGGGNSLFLEDGSFVRLSNARFTYRLDPKYAKKVFARNLSVYMYGVNLLTYTNYTGYDPEFSPSSGLTPGDDTGKYPKRRELGFGLTMGF